MTNAQTVRLADLLERAARVLAVTLRAGQWVDCTWSELTDRQRAAVWAMLENAYQDIGMPVVSIESLDAAKYRFLMLWDADDDQVPNAFAFYRATPAGNKLFMSGTDGDKASKRATIVKRVALLQQNGWYAEMSDPLAAHIERAGIKRIDDEALVRRVLGRDITWLGDGYYERAVTNVGLRRKALYGRPRG